VISSVLFFVKPLGCRYNAFHPRFLNSPRAPPKEYRLILQETFTALPTFSERFTSSAALQYYQLLPSLKELVTYIQLKICSAADSACQTKAASLIVADYLDIDYDSISHALVLNVFRHQPPELGTWNEKFTRSGASSKVEVGVLTSERAVEAEELTLGGFLTVVGKDTKPSTPLTPISNAYLH
jgi:hypothetical protein